MRCIFDSNVFVASLLSRQGSPAKLLQLWIDGAFELVVSPRLVSELERVLTYPKIKERITPAEATWLLAYLHDTAVMVDDPEQTSQQRSPDLDDEYLIVLAEYSKAVVVSGDRHLLGLKDHLPIYTPADFLNMLMRRDALPDNFHN